MDICNWLRNRLIEINKNLEFNLTFEVYEEQNYIKPNLDKNKISVAIKQLSSVRVYETLVQPIQIMVLSEENSLMYARLVFEKLSEMYNYFQVKESNNAIKFNISNPAVLQNYNVIGSGLRSVLYVSMSLVILENISDLEELKIDGENIKFISSNLGYGASFDTVQKPTKEIAESRKVGGSFNMNIALSCTNTNFITKCLKVMFGDTTVNPYVTANTIKIGNVTSSGKVLQIQSVSFGAAINDVPTLLVGLVE